MSFTAKVKGEILNKPIKSKCCKFAFLSGLIRGNGRIYQIEDKIGIEFKVDSDETLSRVIEYLKILFDYDVREISYEQDKRHNKDKITVSIFGEDAIKILTELSVLIEEDNGYRLSLNMCDNIKDRECCLKSFFKGLFLSVGNCLIPSVKKVTSGYHGELVFFHNAPAYETLSLLLKVGIESKIIRRRDAFVVYVKSGEQIQNLLAYLGCPLAVCDVANLMIEREISNKSNRQKNCDLGNLNRQVNATAHQIDSINKIIKAGLLEKLKPPLKETALARLDNPEDSAIELAEKLNVTKSCFMHRMRKLIKIAEEL